jgi:hypothetical protein
MPTSIANFTEEPIEWKHGGMTGVLKPDQVEEFPDSAGNAILNSMGPRGLLRLGFHDNEKERLEELKAKAKEINKQFWIKQIVNFNRQNQIMENEKKAYIDPPKHIVAASEKYGIGLLGPWRAAETEAADSARVKALEGEIGELKEMLAKVMGSIEPKENERVTALKSLYANLKPDEFKQFVEGNTGAILGWPVEVRADLKERWDKDVLEEVWPLE